MLLFVRIERMTKMRLVEDDDVIKAFPLGGSDEPLRESILPGRSS